MKTLNKNILRGILLASYLLIVSLVIAGISSLYGYLNTGADRSLMILSETKKAERYLPEITWNSSENEGRPFDTETKKNIEEDYLDAWFVKQVAYKTNTLSGLGDYYTKNAKQNIADIVSVNKTNNITLESTTLKHNPVVVFFSEDGQLVVLKDENVIEYKKVYHTKKLVAETTEKSSYTVTLLLEDGYWRIRHLVKTNSIPLEITPKLVANETPIKGINYYPKDTPWNMYGKNFDAETIAKDFEIIRNAGLNSIRIFVPYEDFGKAEVDKNRLAQLIKVLDIAEANNLKVMVTLFDFYGNYDVLDWTITQEHARIIVHAVKDHNAFWAWDVKNEPNLDFDSRGEVLVTAWLEKMIDCIKEIDPEHAITIGWSDAKSATILKEKQDLITFHFYEDINELGAIFKQLQKDVDNKPIIITEYGVSSYHGWWKPNGNNEEDQAAYHKQMQAIFAENNIQFMSWTLYDFTYIPTAVVGKLPWRKKLQKFYGFIDKNGNQKPAFKYITTQ